MADNDANQTKPQQGPEFMIQRIFTEDLSFESPRVPQVFQDDWKPELNIDLQTQVKQLDKIAHQVTLQITATVKSNNNVAFVVEVKQAGIFTLQNIPADEMRPILGSVCPGIIYPYAREVISDIVARGGFPPLYLAPINFDVLYEQHLREQEAKGKKEDKASDEGKS